MNETYEIGSELAVSKSFYKHVGAYLGNDLIFHNHPKRGEEIITLDCFAKGRPIEIRKRGVSDVKAFLDRVRVKVSNPSSYQLLVSNCEHTVSKLRSGVASSPQIWFWGAVGLATLITIKSKSK